MKNNPPVSEVAITVQFESLGELTVLDYASFYDLLKDRFPVLQQVVPGPPMGLDEQVLPKFEIMGKPEMPRIWCVSSDSRQLVQFQHDRLSFNWRRMSPVAEPENYPGYLSLMQDFVQLFEQTKQWVSERFTVDIKPIVGELMYNDLVSMAKPDGTKRRLSEVFAFYKAGPPDRPLAGFTASWREKLKGPPDGRVQFQCFLAVLPDNTPAATMNFAARTNLAGAVGGPVDWFEESHAMISEMFGRIVITPAEHS
jgi:uncharacterized protein (TIGR04255 family)